MLLSLTPQQGIAWFMASDESWARYFARVHDAAAERGDSDEQDDDTP